VENRDFPHPTLYLRPAEGGLSWKIVTAIALRGWKEFEDMCIRFDTISECDGQTDRHTDGFAVTIFRSACIGMLMRDKNETETVK